MPGAKQSVTVQTITEFNNACDLKTNFDPTLLDGKSTTGLKLPKSNWAQQITTAPFRAYPVTGGITFTYGGLKVSKNGLVMRNLSDSIQGLYACGELVGGVFFNGYPGGSGLTSGLVFGRKAGYGAAEYVLS
jgi:tricarballylate dehydrogenase